MVKTQVTLHQSAVDNGVLDILKKTFAEKEIPVLDELNERTLVIDAPQTTFDNMKEQGNVFDEVKEVE